MFNIKEIDVQQLYDILNDDTQSYRLIDVRTPAEVAQAHIEGGENIPLHLIPLKVDELRGDKQLIIYCRTGARSGQACAFLQSKGIDNAVNVRGGIVAWAQMGFPISR